MHKSKEGSLESERGREVRSKAVCVRGGGRVGVGVGGRGRGRGKVRISV